MPEVTIERTGRFYVITSLEYLVTAPNGDKFSIWSPPLSDMNCKEEDDAAKVIAQRACDNGAYEPILRREAKQKYAELFGTKQELKSFLGRHWPQDEEFDPCI